MSINRREFLETAGGAIAGSTLLSLPLLHAAGAAALRPSRLIPEDKGFTPAQLAALRTRGERRVYRGTHRYAIGMPCGGVAAGQLYILGDGTLGGWHIDGRLNGTGYGGTSYQTQRPPRELKQGFRVVTGTELGQRSEWVLADPESGGAYDAIEFIGEYPVAEVHYKASVASAVPPLEITLRAGSPFIPLNSRDSAMPCTLMRFTLRNRGSAPITGALQGWLQSGVEPAEPGQPSAARRNRVVRSAALTSVVMDAVAEADDGAPNEPNRLLFDFEGADYKGWKLEGDAFGSKPARGTQPKQNPVSGFAGHGLVDSYPGSDTPTGRMTSDPFGIDRRYMTFLIGGGSDQRRTCINLLVDDKIVRTAAGHDDEKLEPSAWDVSEFRGRQARLQIVDAASGPWGHINVDQIALVDRLPPQLQRPRADSLSNGSMALSYLGQGQAAAGAEAVPVATIDAPFTLQPGESTECTFVISWFFPNLHTHQGQMYANWFSSALDVATYVAANAKRLVDQTEAFRTAFYEDTTLPWWLALRLMMPVANLATGTAQWWKNGRFWAWEGVGCCHGTCTHVWNYAQAEARLFPDMSRSTRVMQDLGSAFEEATGRVAFRGEVRGGSDFAADGQAGTILKCLREHFQCADDAFLKANWPRIKLAMEFLIARDADQSPDGMPDGVIVDAQPNTYDIDFVGANTFIGSLYLAALHAAAAMAEKMDDPAAATRYRGIAARGRQWTEANLFNGEYFIQRRPPGDKSPWQYDSGCLGDQLFGQNWARTLDLPAVYDPKLIRTALLNIYRYNWAPQVGVYNAQFPPERYFARDRDGGLFVCTWPNGGRPGEPVRYRDEVWTGCEYQAAAGMMWEGMVDEALVVAKAVDERYDGALHNPWNEVECGDHYARALASWGVLLAITGYTYDGPAGRMGMSPRMTPDNFAAFFSAAEGWGVLSQRRTAGQQTNSMNPRWGRVRLNAFTTTLPETAGPVSATCTVTANGGIVAATVARDGELVTATFGAPVTVEAGNSLELHWRW